MTASYSNPQMHLCVPRRCKGQRSGSDLGVLLLLLLLLHFLKQHLLLTPPLFVLLFCQLIARKQWLHFIPRRCTSLGRGGHGVGGAYTDGLRRGRSLACLLTLYALMKRTKTGKKTEGGIVLELSPKNVTASSNAS